MKTIRLMGRIILILITAACNASPSVSDGTATPKVEEASTSQPNWVEPEVPLEDLQRCISEFEQREGEKSSGAIAPENQVRLEQKYVSTRGWIADLRSDTTKYEIALENFDIIRAVYLDREPPEVTGTSLGKGDSDELRRIVAAISEEEVREAARRYAESRWQPSIIEGLRESDPQLIFHLGRYKFLVAWSQQATGREVLLGLKRIRVYVNPITGEVCSVEATIVEPPETSMIGSEEFQKIVETEFDALLGLDVEYIQIFTEYTKDLKMRSIWFANARFTCPEDVVRLNPLACHGFATLKIDADTGEILEKSAQ